MVQPLHKTAPQAISTFRSRVRRDFCSLSVKPCGGCFERKTADRPKTGTRKGKLLSGHAPPKCARMPLTSTERGHADLEQQGHGFYPWSEG